MQHTVEFGIQVLKGTGVILGSGVLLCLALVFLKTLLQEVEIIFDVASLLLEKNESQLLRTISSVRRFWLALKEFTGKL